MSIGERIEDLRKKANLSQGELAKRMDVSRQAVSKWENDQSSPDTLKLIQLADALNTDVEYLATGKETEKQPAPIVVNLVKKEDRIVEKVVRIPQIKQIVRYKTKIKYVRNPLEYIAIGILCFLIGFFFGTSL